jgi:hypothetical protein
MSLSSLLRPVVNDFILIVTGGFSMVVKWSERVSDRSSATISKVKNRW